ncbi:Serine/threonine-protein phosphatase 4 regulatory subunit 4 [Trichinella sp. T6]|nr:Serine/threonine-protein phosphatase 4 regulatory subunit 4 [Trichinella sp. T6]
MSGDIPLDIDQITADQLIAVLTDGSENQRICVVRNLPGFLVNKLKLLRDVLPTVEAMLCLSNCGMDIQFETCEVFRSILEHAMAKNEQICKSILKIIFKVIDNQDSIVRAAWMEMIIDVIDVISTPLLTSEVLPTALQKSQQMNSIYARLFGGKLLGQIAPKISPDEVRRKILPVVQAQCQDPDSRIRATACQQLPTIVFSADIKSILLPMLIELNKDEDETVREADFEAIVSVLFRFDKETRSNIFMPIIKKCAEDALLTKSTSSLLILAKVLKKLCESLDGKMTNSEKTWIIEIFQQLSLLGTEEKPDGEETVNGDYDYVSKRMDPNIASITCRRSAAAAISILTELMTLNEFRTSLLPVYRRLCQDTDSEVQKQAALSFHIIAKFFDPHSSELMDCFIDLIYSGDTDVIEGLAKHLDETLSYMYKTSPPKKDSEIPTHKSHPSQLTRVLLACNRLIRNSSNWRCHEQYILALRSLLSCVGEDVLITSFVPMLKDEVLHVQAIPCRFACLKTMLTWISQLKCSKQVQNLVDFFINCLKCHKSAKRRVLYLVACEMAIKMGLVELFKEKLLYSALKMIDDPVIDVRLKLCSLFPVFKSALNLPKENNLLLGLQDALSKLDAVEKSVTFKRIRAQVLAEIGETPSNQTNIHAENTELPDKDKLKKPTVKTTAVASVQPIVAVHPTSIPPAPQQQQKLKNGNTLNANVKKLDKAGEAVSDTKSGHIPRASSRRMAIVQPQQLLHRDASPRPTGQSYERVRTRHMTDSKPTSVDCKKASNIPVKAKSVSQISTSENKTAAYKRTAVDKSKPTQKISSNENLTTSNQKNAAAEKRKLTPGSYNNSTVSKKNVAAEKSKNAESPNAPPQPVALTKGGPNGKKIVVKPTPILKMNKPSVASKPLRTPAVICTGSVMKSIAKFEQSMAKHQESLMKKTTSHQYPRRMNQSFTSDESGKSEEDKTSRSLERSGSTSNVLNTIRNGSQSDSKRSSSSYSLTRVKSSSVLYVRRIVAVTHVNLFYKSNRLACCLPEKATVTNHHIVASMKRRGAKHVQSSAEISSVEQKKRQRFKYPSLPSSETAFYFAVILCTIFYTWYKVFQLSNEPQVQNNTVAPLTKSHLWLIGDKLKDTNNYEWQHWIVWVREALPWYFLHSLLFNCTEKLLGTTLWKRFMIVYWIFASWYLFATHIVLTVFIAATVMYGAAYWLRSKLAVWTITLGILYVAVEGIVDFAADQDAFKSISFIGYKMLQCLSFCLDLIDNQPVCEHFFDGFFKLAWYILYLPYQLSLIVIYKRFQPDMERRNSRDMNLSRTLLFGIRILFWYCFTELLLHHLYFEAISMNVELLTSMPLDTLCCIGALIGQFFHLKYVVIFGFPAFFAKLDKMTPPNGPICISRVTLYSNIWRHFDRGLYEFFKEYIFLPIARPSFRIERKLAGLLLSFSFVLVWHGFRHSCMVWVGLNVVEILIENIGKVIYSFQSVQKLREKLISDQCFRRILALLQVLPLSFGLYSNYYFLGGSKVGKVFVDRIFWGETYPNFQLPAVILVTLGYCFNHLAMEITSRVD